MTTTPNQKGPTMRAWHGNPALKAEVLARMLQHRVQDSIIQGSYQLYAPELALQYRGCLIGCTLPMGKLSTSTWVDEFRSDRVAFRSERVVQNIEEMDWHPMVEELYGVSQRVNGLWERVFEFLPVEEAPWFAVATIEATPVGADMDLVEERLEQEMRAHFKDDIPPRVGWNSELIQLFSRHIDSDDDYRKAVVWVAEMIIRVLKECDPNPIIPFETVADVEEDTRVPVA
jgi:hypothetical protein